MVLATFADTVRELMSIEHMQWIVIGVLITVCSVFKTTASMVRSVSRERTRREIAAFIAEGTMTPEQGDRLMTSGEKPRSC